MKLTAKQIEEVKFTIQEKGYSPKEVDDFLEEIIEDYKNGSINLITLCGGVSTPYNASTSTVKIYPDDNGYSLPDTFEFEGTIAEWQAIENKGIFADVPCINCVDGQYIQKL